MNTPSLAAQLVMVGAVPLLAAYGVRFHRKQAAGAMGGKISRAKAYWLPFAIWFWFVVAPAAGIDALVNGTFDAGAARALAAFGVFMWLRGAAEMFLLYVTRTWRPPMGITHDVLCAVLVVGVAGHGLATAGALTAMDALDAWAYALCGVVVVSLAVEVHHAYSFFVAAQGKTTGHDGIWFADDHDARFARINRNTRAWNVLLSVLVGAFVLRFVTT